MGYKSLLAIALVATIISIGNIKREKLLKKKMRYQKSITEENKPKFKLRVDKDLTIKKNEIKEEKEMKEKE